MGQNVHGSKAGALLDGRDLTRYTTDFNFATDIDMAEQTCLMADGGAKEYLYGNAGSSAGLDGRLAKSRPQLERELDAIRGKEEGAKLFLQAPAGFAPGSPAVIFQTLKEKLSIKGGMTNVNSTGMSFTADGVARIASMLLAPRVQGGANVTRNEIQTLTFVSADPNQFFGLRANGTTQTWQFQLSSYATDAALAAAVKTGIEGLTAYVGRTATVTVLTPRSGGTALSLALQVVFDGATNVAGLEAISGAVDSFVVTVGDSANYSANGGANFTLGIAEAAFQTNQRTLGGERQDVVCKGSSVANTGPGKSQTITGSGNALSIGGVAVDLTTPESVATLVGRIKTANPTRTTLAGTGTIAAASTPTPSASTSLAGYPVSQINDNSATTFWASDSPAYPQWVKLDNGSAKPMSIISIRARNTSGANAPKDFTIETSNTGAFSGEQTVASAQTGVTFAAGELKSFAFTQVTARYIRIYISAGGVASQNVEIAEFAHNGQVASVSIALTDNASAGNVADLTVTGTGYNSTSTAPQPNGTANFKSYFPLNRAPAAPTKIGVGATHTRLANKGDVAASLTGATVQEGGTFSGLNLITAPTNFPAVKTADAATPTGATIDLHATFVSSGALSVPVLVEHSADGATGWATLATFVTITDATNRAQLAQRIVLPDGTLVQPWLRVRVPTLTGSVAPGVALARKPS